MRVLDGFDLQVANEVARPPRRKAPHRLLELLKGLAACGGRAVTADRLCDVVWPDADRDAARRSLDTSLSRLRRLLGHEDSVQMQAGKVSLDPHWVRLDLQVFAERLERLEREPPGSSAWAASAERALEPYRRALLADDVDEPWLLAERERWRRRWLAVVRRLAQYLHGNGEPARACALLDAAIAIAIDGDPAASVPGELVALRKSSQASLAREAG